ncbi:MAG: rhomboid family intramembrane serine protease [Luteolibacter sp.]
MKHLNSGLWFATRLMEESDANAPTPWDDLVLVGQYSTLEQAQDHGLVILAMGEACWVSSAENDGEFNLHAEAGPAIRIIRELQIYAGELDDQRRLKSRPEPVDPFHYSAGWYYFFAWMVCQVVVFSFQYLDFTLLDRGASSSIGLIDRHEWWRPFTALFLHADIQHLVGNLLSGAVFGTLVSRSLGPLRGWMMILACGTMGNILTSYINYPEHIQSIGASTAVFGALGILTGLGFSTSLHHHSRTSWARVAAPVLAGIILLSWLGSGSGSPNTDVLGHVFGFASGLVSGVIAGEMRQKLAKTPELSMV